MTDVIAAGKTKRLWPYGPPVDKLVDVESLNTLTAKDGAVRASFEGKGALANATTCHVFERLKHHGVPLAYVRREGDRFISRLAEMIPVEVVIRNKATGSYLKRNEGIEDGHVFESPVVEFYYKTTGSMCFGVYLGVDDPLMLFSDDGTRLTLHHPGRPINHEEPLLEVTHEQMTVADRRFLHEQLKTCRQLAQLVNRYLTEAWRQLEGDLIDLKIECGVVDGRVVVADVIDCDSWRVMYKGQQLSKQPFREGEGVDKMKRIYTLVEAMLRTWQY